jgi:hypothetical protein
MQEMSMQIVPEILKNATDFTELVMTVDDFKEQALSIICLSASSISDSDLHILLKYLTSKGDCVQSTPSSKLPVRVTGILGDITSANLVSFSMSEYRQVWPKRSSTLHNGN